MQKNKGIHFEVSERKLLLLIFDLAFVLFGLYAIDLIFDIEYFQLTKQNWIWSLVLVIYLTTFGFVFELYDLKQASKLDSTFKNVLLAVSVTVIFYFFTPIITPFLPEKRIEFIYFYVVIIAAILLWRWIYVSFIVSPRFYKRVLVVGEVSNIENIIKTICVADPNYKVVGYVNTETDKNVVEYNDLEEFDTDNLDQTVKNSYISEIVVAINNSKNITPAIYNQLILLLEKGFVIREYTQVFEEITKRVPVQFVGKDFYKHFPFSRSNQNKLYLFFHRVMDVVCAIIGLIVGMIFVPFIVIGNLIGNKGALFYTQERVGKNGKPFRIIKYRTMVSDAEAQGAKWAVKNDIRVTPFGRFLRNSRLDEIPQFINVLKGDMSIIGPRPERPVFVKKLSQSILFYETRHVVKPGLSGWAQVNTRYGASVEDSIEKLEFDLYYIKHRSFLLDINIIIKTISTIVYYRGQ
ncbi:MAG: sugar transferase [Flavobacteriaceae bacterium]|nr:sugar transferase [Flavobacteriaceae bacterium]